MSNHSNNFHNESSLLLIQIVDETYMVKLLLNKFVVSLHTVFTTQLSRALQIHTLVAIFILSEVKDIYLLQP